MSAARSIPNVLLTESTPRAPKALGGGEGRRGIVTIEHPDDSSESQSVFASLLSVYEQRGFEAGHRKALNDVLDSLVRLAEEFIRRQPQEPGPDEQQRRQELRRVIYAFEEHLERRINALSELTIGYVEGGLGI